MTKTELKKIIDANKEMTSYFDNQISLADMYSMLRYRMQFGEAETKIILASLQLAGAKFKID